MFFFCSQNNSYLLRTNSAEIIISTTALPIYATLDVRRTLSVNRKWINFYHNKGSFHHAFTQQTSFKLVIGSHVGQLEKFLALLPVSNNK